MVDVVRDPGIKVAQGIVGERREVHDRVESFQVLLPDIPEIQPQLGNGAEARSERTPLKEVAVEADHLMAGIEQDWCHYGTDVTFVSGEQDAHSLSS